MTERKGLVPVTSKDEDAAVAWWRQHQIHGFESELLEQAFARHRADALTEALRVVREARERVRKLHISSASGEREVQHLLATLTAFLAQHEGERP